METYKWDESRSYIIADIKGQKALIDTGAGECVGLHPFEMGGKRYKTVANYGGMTVADLAKSVRYPGLTHLVGLEVLGSMPWQLDWSNRTITFNPQSITGTAVPLIKDYIWGPIWKLDVKFKLNGRKVQAILDTGAPMSYMPRVEGVGESKGIYPDFFPMGGEFTARVFERKIDIGPLRQFPVEFGVIPPNSQLSAILDRWILGQAILRNRVTTFDVPNEKLYLN